MGWPTKGYRRGLDMSAVKSQVLSGEYGDEAMMTVGDLVRELVILPQDFVVRTEGCDCYGGVTEVAIDRKERKVYLNRKPGQL